MLQYDGHKLALHKALCSIMTYKTLYVQLYRPVRIRINLDHNLQGLIPNWCNTEQLYMSALPVLIYM